MRNAMLEDAESRIARCPAARARLIGRENRSTRDGGCCINVYGRKKIPCTGHVIEIGARAQRFEETKPATGDEAQDRLARADEARSLVESEFCPFAIRSRLISQQRDRADSVARRC